MAERDRRARLEQKDAAPRVRPTWASSPEVEVHETTAGRETLSAIAAELLPKAREPMSTLRYGDRLSNAPGAKSPRSVIRAPRLDAPLNSAPEISVGQSHVGRETLAAIHRELGEPIDLDPAEELESATIFEMATFVVRSPNPTELSSEAARRSFVERRLLHRLPVDDMHLVDRIDVTPWTVQNTVIVRVWCRIDPPG